jgi:TolB-like protein
MMLTKLLAVVLVLGCAVPPALAEDGQPSEGAKKAGARPAPAYRPYFYNYPHAIPPDYVFRTSRVFSPQNLSQSAAAGFASGPPANSPADSAEQGAALHAGINELGQALMANAGEAVAEEYAVAVSTFVSLDNLYATSSLGRYLGEQLLSVLQQAGLEVIEVRKTPGLLMSPTHGEYALSRSMDEISPMQMVQAVVVGTYAVAGEEIFVNARLLRNQDNMVLSTATLVLPVDALTANLLADESMPASSGSSSQVTIRQFQEKDEGAALAPAEKSAKTAVRRPTKKGGS